MATLTKTFAPTRAFFRVSQPISSIRQAREVFKTLGNYGEMVEYKVMRCPETLNYMRYGFVVYKNKEDAEKAIGDQFVKIQSELFDKPLEVKIEKSVNSNSTQQRRNRYKDQ